VIRELAAPGGLCDSLGVLVRSFFPILPGLKGVLPVVLAVASAAGCVVGAGSGSAKGPLWIEGCLEGKPYGTPDDPADFDLAPTFFAGEPIEDFADTNPTNRLIIRMQRTGNEPQISDTLFFDIPDSGKVADCLRGRTVAACPIGIRGAASSAQTAWTTRTSRRGADPSARTVSPASAWFRSARCARR